MPIKAGVTNASAPSRRSKLGYNTVDANPYHSLGDNMNANELADDLNGGDVSYITMDKAATMLRQQQAEIEALKAELRLIDELVTGKAQNEQ